MNSLVVAVSDEVQVLNPIVGLVAIEMMDVHAMRNRAVCGSPDNAVLEVADTRTDIDADVAAPGEHPFASAPVPVVRPLELMGRWRTTGIAKLAPVRVPAGGVFLLNGRPAGLTGLRVDTAHVHMVQE
jgi:hypothetical protein